MVFYVYLGNSLTEWSLVLLMSELDKYYMTKQTISAKVNSQEGNSPEYSIKWLIGFSEKGLAIF